MKYLLTGGSGFIGTNLIQRIIKDENNSVTSIDLKMPILHERMDSWAFEYHLADIETEDIDDYFIGKDVVIHLACQPGVEASVEDPVGTFKQNVYGTIRCLEAARKAGVKRFIFSSSGGTVLGKKSVPLREDLCPEPRSPYGASKLACEGYCRAYNASYGLETIILRFSNVYGPFSIHKGFNLIPGFIMAAISNDTCFINGDGRINKDYIFVEDLVTLIMSAATSTLGIGGEVFQIATGVERSILDIKEILNKLSEKLLSRSLKVKHRDERIGDVTYSCNINKAQTKLNLAPVYDLEEGLELTFKWYIDNFGG